MAIFWGEDPVEGATDWIVIGKKGQFGTQYRSDMSIHPIPFRALGLALAVFAGASGAGSEPDWSDWDLEARISAVGDSELRLLPEGVPTGVHVHENHISIEAQSLADGWVALSQCHEHMDAVPAAEVTFNPKRIRNLRITNAVHIGRAWVEAHTVQLEDIETGARLCVSAESRALSDLGQGYYRLRNGPYMRRFLDGYFPMRVLIDVQYSAETLDLVRSQPADQPGFAVRSEPGRVRVDVSFEGRLHTCLDFRAEAADDRSLPNLPCPDG